MDVYDINIQGIFNHFKEMHVTLLTLHTFNMYLLVHIITTLFFYTIKNFELILNIIWTLNLTPCFEITPYFFTHWWMLYLLQ